MNVKKLHVKSVSDIHLGHAKTPTEHILDNLERLFPNDTSFKCDVLFIPGDVFDRLMSVPDVNVARIKIWINRLLRLCVKYDVVLRIVEGTPLHDRGQSRLFIDMNEMVEIGADVKYVSVLSIEYIERYDIHVLYVPDEWHPGDTLWTWQDVQSALADHGIEQVDFAIMHGAFDYQLPSHIAAQTHDPERYESVVRYLIFIGHVHTFSQRGKILAQGSVDRLAHNQEEAKGYLDCIVRSNGDHDITFVENEHAMPYKTVDCKDLSFDDAYKQVDKLCQSLPPGHVRIEAPKLHGIFGAIKTFAQTYPHLSFTRKQSEEERTEAVDLLKLDEERYQPIEISRANVVELLTKRLQERGWTDEQCQYAAGLLGHYV